MAVLATTFISYTVSCRVRYTTKIIHDNEYNLIGFNAPIELTTEKFYVWASNCKATEPTLEVILVLILVTSKYLQVCIGI